MIQDAYVNNRKSFILEFLYLEKYLALRTEQVLDQMKHMGNVASFTPIKPYGNCKTVNLCPALF